MPDISTDIDTSVDTPIDTDVSDPSTIASAYESLSVQPISSLEDGINVTHASGTASVLEAALGIGRFTGGSGISYVDGEDFALRPDGTDYVVDDSNTQLVVPFEGASGDFTIAWIGKVDTDLPCAVISASDADGGNNWWYFGHGVDRILRLAQFDGGYQDIESVVAPPSGSVYFAVMRFDQQANIGSVRLNGGNEVSGTLSRSPSGIDQLAIAARVNTSVNLQFEGDIRDVLIFDQHLEGSDLAALEAALFLRSRASNTWQTELPDVAGWWKQGQGESVVANNLNDWQDQINGYDLTALAAVQRPIPDASGWRFVASNLCTLRHVGALATAVQEDAPYTLLISAKAVTLNEFQALAGFFDDAVNAQIHLLRHDDNNVVSYTRRYLDSAQAVLGGTALDANKHVLACTFSGTQSRIWVDGVADSAPVSMDQNPLVDRFSVGSLDRATAVLQPYDGVIHQVIVCLGELSAQEIADASALMLSEMP